MYMSLGMTYEEFWFGTPRIAEYYRKAHQYRQDEQNFGLWLQGYYNHLAVSIALSNAFKAKGKKADEYLKEPIPLRQKTKKEMDAEQERKNAELVNKLTAMQKRWVAQHRSGDANAE